MDFLHDDTDRQSNGSEGSQSVSFIFCGKMFMFFRIITGISGMSAISIYNGHAH